MDDLEQLHQQYQRQAAWTTTMRQYLLSTSVRKKPTRILEVGCGTGVILSELAQQFPHATITGIDLDYPALQLAHTASPISGYAQSNALNLPFAANRFDLVVCHFFLLWAAPLQPILTEILRCLAPHAPLIAFAEPDYGGRIDFPAQLSLLGHWQAETLRMRGAQPNIGRQIAAHFQQAGLMDIETRLMGGEWSLPQPQSAYTPEWDRLEMDLELLEHFDRPEFKRLKALAGEYEVRGTRLLYVPTFSAVGFKPGPQI